MKAKRAKIIDKDKLKKVQQDKKTPSPRSFLGRSQLGMLLARTPKERTSGQRKLAEGREWHRLLAVRTIRATRRGTMCQTMMQKMTIVPRGTPS